MQPVLTQVPPTSLRSITATVWPGGGQPARQRRAGLAGADDDRVEFAVAQLRLQTTEASATIAKPPTHGDGVLDERDRQVVAAVGGDQPLARLVAAERADHRADDAGAHAATERVVRQRACRSPRRRTRR